MNYKDSTMTYIFTMEEEMLKVKDCIGKKCIVQRDARTAGDFIEVEFKKLSDSGNHVLEKINGSEKWEEIIKYDGRWKIVDTIA
jgi:hypothetical protein